MAFSRQRCISGKRRILSQMREKPGKMIMETFTRSYSFIFMNISGFVWDDGGKASLQ
jgi:hypothetical protein